ncbi:MULTISPECIES: DUF2788 domain-containing protein [Alishewanella]|jgi:hypothetical protein|uniref:DUF2788 domain-containing protein n=1 Tax=Alishewanella jeotgali KCTC 22429 TaxID=1129374 RepID=H3ZJ96_9ALTE|nr:MULTISPECIES: DUF2788 domain-containing protein [Alishewanella]EHR39355.1 hypothetical protein AJE_17310 [Alishewanella jeotgali KCTC 22429]MCT8125883.1 DUF2788 domain-containing protein [Alishewanella sp. BS5-314]
MNVEQFESIGLWLGLGALYIFIVLAIRDVLKKSQAPKMGQFFVWLVLFLSPLVFIVKSVMQYFFE